MCAKYKAASKPCSECGEMLYISQEEEFVDGTIFKYTYLECPQCGYSELKNEQRYYKPKASEKKRNNGGRHGSL